MKVKEIMTPSVEYMQADNSIKDAAIKMKELDIGVLPIVSGNRAIGIITDRDIVTRSVAQGLDPAMHQVVEAYSEDIITCKEDDDVKSAADLMEENKIRRLVVTDGGGNIRGILSLGDLALNTRKGISGDVLQEVSSPA